MTTVLASFATTDFTPSVLSAVVDALAGSLIWVNVNTTSSAVTADPSDHLRPGFSFHVTVGKSLETPPFATVGMLSARAFAIGFASGPHDAGGPAPGPGACPSLGPVPRG